MPPPNGPPSRSQSRPSSSSSSTGGYRPPSPAPSESSYDFCNAFWVHGGKKTPENASPGEMGKEGFEALTGRMKSGVRTVEDLRAFFRERAQLEEDHAKKVLKLSKTPVGSLETGHLERAFTVIKQELETSARSHSDLAALLKQQDLQMGEFLQQREASRKPQQIAIEKAWKTKKEQSDIVHKAKSKYENDALSITAMMANAALSQGRDLDKVQMKLDKAQQSVVVNEREYRNYVAVLKETTLAWNQQWKVYCDTCQDQEEERLELMRVRLWDWANSISTVAMVEDESAERMRTALEQCDPITDLKIFVKRAGTGSDIPDPPQFVDHSRKENAAKQGFVPARFPRSSARAVRHTPADVDDIARALHKSSAQQQQQPLPQQQQRPPSQSTAEKRKSTGPPGGAIAATVAANAMDAPRPGASSRPVFAPPAGSLAHSPNSLPNLDNVPSTRSISTLADQSVPSSRPPAEIANSPSRFSLVATMANASPRGASDKLASTKPGHATASAFQRRSPSGNPRTLPSQDADRLDASSPPARYEAPVSQSQPTAEVVDDDDDDPITQALKQLAGTISPSPVRGNRASAGPMVGAVALPGMAVPQQQQHQQPQGVRRERSAETRASVSSQRPLSHRQSQASLGRGAGEQYGRQGAAHSHSSRPTSPAPTASMMQPPPHSPSQGQGVVDHYAQAFPGERSRPSSRQGSVASNNPNRFSNGANLQSPGGGGGGRGGQGGYGRPASPQPFAGVGARGRSPSPQPYAPPPGSGGRPLSGQGERPVSYHQPQPSSASQQFQFQSLAAVRPISPFDFGQQYGSAPPAPSGPPLGYPQGGGGGGGYGGGPQHPHQIPQQQQQQQRPPQQQQQPLQQQQYPQQQQHDYQSPAPQHFSHPSQASLYHQAPSQPAAQAYHSSQPSLSSHQSPFPDPSAAYGGPQTHHQPPPTQQQQYGQPSPQSQSAPSPVPSAVGGPGAPPPTGQYTEDGRPILFYVTALYDYEATNPEEFSFSTGDVIAVTTTDPDGWWQGSPVGVSGGGKTFPSNFTELLS